MTGRVTSRPDVVAWKVYGLAAVFDEQPRPEVAYLQGLIAGVMVEIHMIGGQRVSPRRHGSQRRYVNQR